MQLLERVSRERNQRLKQLAQAAERPANPLIFNGTERRVSPLAVGGKPCSEMIGHNQP